MSAVKVNFEIGHLASLRSKKTPEGFTHDWEVFVRGQEGADISHFVDKVVFHLHDTFPKPKRVVKEPPFSVKESGYAGFLFPIEIYLKNKDEPKKIQFTYDFTLQQSGFLKDRYIFQNPNEEFRKKLLKGGGIPVSNNAYYTNPDQENRSRDSFTEDKQMVSKPKLSTENVKKHKSKEHKEEIPHRTSSFETLFGAPIQKPPKVSPDPKKMEKSSAVAKSDKKEKDRSSSDKKPKHEHKEVKPDKSKSKEDKDRTKTEKKKSHSKEPDKPKDKASKRPSERPPSPEAKKRAVSPSRRLPSPPPRSNSASSIKDEYKPKHNSETFEQKKPKHEEKPPEVKPEKEIKEKKKKEKKSHDRDKERKEKKEHKKEHKSKDLPKEPVKEIPKETTKETPKPKEKEKDPTKESPTVKEKALKPEKVVSKFSIENLRKTPPPENEERSENHKKEKGDSEKHKKHKKKDKKRDESREKNKESNKEKKHKHEKREEKSEITERRPTPVPKEKTLPEPASPISIDTASQCSSKSGLVKALHVGAEDINSSQSDSESSMIADDEDVKVKIENPSPEPVKREPSPEPEPEAEPEPEPEPEAEIDVEPEPEPQPVEPPPKEKVKKHKDKSRKEEKRRKRKAAEEETAENRKVPKTESGPSNDTDRGETSGSSLVSSETKVQDNGVSSSLGEDAEPGDISPDYMVQLRGLQQRIMMIKNNDDLERVVNLIAETGRYEVTTQTFDFDLCLLDRSTVQQLIQLVGC